MVGSGSIPNPASEVDRCKGSSPHHSLPWRTDTDEGDHGAVCVSVLALNQVNRRVGNDDPPVVAKCWELVCPAVANSPAPHCLVKAPPMQRPKDGRDDDIEIAADRRVGRMARDLGDRVTPLIDDAATIHRHRGARARSSRLRSIHNLITVRANCRFTSRRFLRHFAGFEHQGCDIPESLNGSYARIVSLISATSEMSLEVPK